MRQDRRAFALQLGAGALGLAAGPLLAQTSTAFPSRPVRIVPFGIAGAPLDILSRAYGEKLQARWGQPVIVEPKPGAGGIIAADFVAKAPADGHTVLFTLPISHINAPILQPKMPYDAFKDFQPLTMVGTGGVMLVARANAPYNTAREFIDHARKQPKGLTYGTWGNGSSGHLFGELLQRQSGANLIHAAYKSEANAHADLFGETLDFAWANPATARMHAQSGRIKVLGVTGTRRLSVLPGVPTLTEQGFAGFDLDSWWGVYGPAKMPQAAVDAWHAAFREITATPEMTARVVGFGLEPLVNSPAQFAERMKADYGRYAELIKAAGVTVE